jgi:hypothetical protein
MFVIVVAAATDHRRVRVTGRMIVQIVQGDVHRHRRAKERQYTKGDETSVRTTHSDRRP